MIHIARSNGSFAIDFHNEIYPEAKDLLNGHNPYPSITADLSNGSNRIWPPLAAYLVSPLTALSPSIADGVMVLIGLAAFAAALWITRVRDWRVYGAASLWGAVISDTRTAHLTLVLCLLVAIVWRMQARTAVPGLILGVAITLKFFLWPLVIWLASLRRWREAALAAVVASVSLMLLLPFISILEYGRLLRRLGTVYDQDSFTPYGLLVQAGSPSSLARVLGYAVGVSLLGLAWRRRSFALFTAAALALSPIVWLDYFALTAVPLAVVRPTFSWIWLFPILTFGVPAAGVGIGETPQTLRVLGIFAVVVWYTTRRESREPLAAVGTRPSNFPAPVKP